MQAYAAVFDLMAMLLRWTPSFISLFEGWHGDLFGLSEKEDVAESSSFSPEPLPLEGNSFGGQNMSSYGGKSPLGISWNSSTQVGASSFWPLSPTFLPLWRILSLAAEGRPFC
jgi:hypothetical protein